jgi:hypothetical protein
VSGGVGCGVARRWTRAHDVHVNSPPKSGPKSHTLKSVRKMRNSEVITLDYIHIENNLADLFIKNLSHNVIDIASKEIDLRPT